MRVAIYVLRLTGGAFTNVATSLARGFADLGTEIDVVFIHPDLSTSRVGRYFLVGLGLPRRARLIRLGSSRSLTGAPALARYLRQNNPDVLISLGWTQNPTAVLAKLVSGWSGVLLLSEHGIMSYEARVEHRRELRLRAMPAIARALYPRAHGLAAVSAPVLEDLVDEVGLSRDDLPMRVIPNPIDADMLGAKAKMNVGHPFLEGKEEPVVLSVGRLSPQKNHGLLLEAVAKLRHSRKVRLIILGEGPERPTLERKVHELGLSGDVDLPGFAANPFPYMSRADVFALSSHEEGFGLALLEAMAVGCPVVAASCPGGPSDLLQGGRCGALVEQGNADDLANALDRVLADERYRRSLIAAGLSRARDFAPRDIAEKWLSFADEAKGLATAR